MWLNDILCIKVTSNETTFSRLYACRVVYSKWIFRTEANRQTQCYYLHAADCLNMEMHWRRRLRDHDDEVFELGFIISGHWDEVCQHVTTGMRWSNDDGPLPKDARSERNFHSFPHKRICTPHQTNSNASLRNTIHSRNDNMHRETITAADRLHSVEQLRFGLFMRKLRFLFPFGLGIICRLATCHSQQPICVICNWKKNQAKTKRGKKEIKNN